VLHHSVASFKSEPLKQRLERKLDEHSCSLAAESKKKISSIPMNGMYVSPKPAFL
jgi:hypothetical protein